MRNNRTQIGQKKGQVPRLRSGQAIIEMATFGAIVIFLIGVILRTHLSTTLSMDHQVRAMKLALQQSNENSLGANGKVPNSSRNSASVLFIEDRLSPDFNKYNTIDRSPFTAAGSGTMSNRLEYPIDFVTYGNEPFGEVGNNLPAMDLFINGQHFPLTVSAYVFRVLYTRNESCPADPIEGPNDPNNPLLASKGPEYYRCLRQQAEMVGSDHTFYGFEVNGTAQFDASASNATFDLLRNNYSTLMAANASDDDVGGCRGAASKPATVNCNEFAWQWRYVTATADRFLAPIPSTAKDVILSFGTSDAPNYPVADTSGSNKEQTIYAVSQSPSLLTILSHADLTPYEINGNPHLLSLTQNLINDSRNYVIPYNFSNDPLRTGVNPLGLTRTPKAGPITGVIVLDPSLGDIDQGYDPKSSPGPMPGLMPEMEIYSRVNQGTYLQIKEGKLYNPETGKVVRTINSKDHVDLISRSIQFSNNTGRFCMIQDNVSTNRYEGHGLYRPATLADQNNEPNPVEVCADNCFDDNASKTCYSPSSRILYVRTSVGDSTKRKWFTDVTKGL